MKKRLNFITILIGVAIGISIINSESIMIIKESVMMVVKDAYDQGKKIGYEHRKEGKELNLQELKNLKYVQEEEFLIFTLAPIINYTMPDELVNMKDGKILPMRIYHAMVKVPIAEKSILTIIATIFSSFLALAALIMVVFNFLRIIIAVNKSVIFEWTNVKRLRRMGTGFVLMFVVSSIFALIQNNSILKLVELENYKIVNPSYDGGILFLGIITFLVAEIFAVGLRLREEQELTI